MSRYTIGIDCGTLSARVVVVDVNSGRELSCAESVYAHGVIDRKLPDCDVMLPNDWALQDPGDYLKVLQETVPEAVTAAGVDPKDIIGICIDSTTSTLLPVDQNGQALCMMETWRANPHAWVKLWKHHAAQDYADRMTEIAEQRNESWLARYGNKISSEWTIPKIWQILEEAPELYEAAYTFIEISDWLTLKMTGEWVKNACALGYKALWSPREGFPSHYYLKALHPNLEHLVEEKLIKDAIRILPIGRKAGELTEAAAAMMGLCPGTAVAVSLIDAHVTMPAVKITEPGKMLLIMGTSTCDIVLGDEEKGVPGICGSVEDGVIPGYYAYEAGQSGVGDVFGWFVDNCVPESYYKETKDRGIGIHQLLEEKASAQTIGQHGLIAMDWLNGNRSVLVDAELSGMLVGMTLQTRPEDIYRALIEATAFGQKLIFEIFAENQVTIKSVYAAGGLPEKNKMMMQIYADVLNLEIHLSGSKQAPALGSAIYAATAAGKERGGYDTLKEAAEAMGALKDESYRPIADNVRKYEVLYQEYKKLHDYFGRGENPVMKLLRRLRTL